MNCYKNFNLSFSQNFNYSNAGVNVASWGPTGVEFWEVYDNSRTTTKLIQGFKNINIYKVEIIGDVASTLSTNKANVQDWGFAVSINGQQSIIGGAITNNDYVASQTDTSFFLTKYKTEIFFPDGITSVQSVSIIDFFASGEGAQTANNVTLALRADIVFYYKFEGE